MPILVDQKFQTQKMKKVALIFAVILFASCQKEKIAYVDNVKLFEGINEKEALDKKYETKQAQFTKKSDSIAQLYQFEAQRLQGELQRLSQKEQNEKIEEYTKRRDLISRQLEQELQLIQAQGKEEMDSLVQKVRRKIEKYGVDNGYSYILSGGEGGSVLYGKEAMDITEQVLEVINQE